MASWKAFVNALKWAWNSSWSEGNNGVANAIEGTINKYTGAGLTPAEVEANKFSAEQAQINRDWQTQMANTTYQRTVADLKAAGLNPALAYGNSVVPTPSGSSPSSTGVGSSVGLLDLILQMRQLSNQDKQLKIQDKLANAEIRNKNANTNKVEVETSWIDTLNQLKVDSQNIVNELNEEQRYNLIQQRDLVVKQIENISQDIKESESRIILNKANEALARADARQIIQMLPYNIALSEARTQAEQAGAFLDWAYQAKEIKLIDAGYYDSLCKQAFGEANVVEYNAKQSAYDFVLHTGSHLSGVGEKLFHGLQTFGEATKGLGAMFGLVTGLGVAKINSLRRTGDVKKYYDSSTGSVGYRIQ